MPVRKKSAKAKATESTRNSKKIKARKIVREKAAQSSEGLAVRSDITGRKWAQEKVSNAAQEWQRTFDTINAAIWILDKDQRVLRSNKTADLYFHRTSYEFIGKHCWEIVHGSAQPIPECPILRVKKSLHREEMDLKIGERWYVVTVDPILDEAGRFSGAVHIVSDITERKRVEEALRQSEERFRWLFERHSAVKLVIDPETGNIANANEAAAQFYGWSIEKLKQMRIQQINVLPPEAVKAEIKKVVLSERTRFEFRHRIADGSIRDVEVFSNKIELTEKVFLYSIIHDITERKRVEEEKAKLEGQLRQAQKMESVGRLAGGVAHDFNNMLSVILGYAELSLKQVDPAQPLHANLTEIRKAAERAADLTRQLLAFARKQTVAPKVLDLNKTVAGILKMLQRLIGEDIHINWQPKPDLWPVKVDPSQIDQILANLCVNARDAIADVGKITIATGNNILDADYCADHPGFVAGEYVRLAVSDDGCGMNRETLDKLFEPFFTTKELGKGTGLGLATIYGIVKQNNGFIDVYSEPGSGTTFTIYLPRHAGKAEQARTEDMVRSALRGHEIILLVEDEPAILEITRMMLEHQGYTVLAASTPGEAIRLAREHAGEIHLLMTDVVMPEMNGRDLAKNLLSLYPDLKRLFMSGYTADLIAHHGVLDEGVYFIQKPITIKELAAKVREALESE